MDVPLSNDDVAAHLQDVDGFMGVYSYDLLPPLRDGEFCVVNTDNATMAAYDPPEGGHHWVTVCREGNRVLIFDSFGRTLHDMERDYTEPGLARYFRQACPNCALYTNTQVLQDTSTAVCGRYAILMGTLFSSQGIDQALHTLQRAFTADTLDNDRRMVGGSLADELHKQRRVHFPRRKVIAYGIDQVWSADLVDMQAFSKFNKGYRFMLTVIDLFSRFA